MHCNPVGNCMVKVNYRKIRTRCYICSQLTIKTPERRPILNELWTYFTPCSSVSIVNFEQVNAGWEYTKRLTHFWLMFSPSYTRVASHFWNKNSRTIQGHFKNISMLFKNTSGVENIITIDLKVFFKKPNLIITKDKYTYQQEQNYESLSIIK